MKIRMVCFLCSCILLASAQVFATPLVKSVDADGNVTYSSRPTVDAESVTDVQIDRGPSVEQIEAAQERVKKTVDEANKAQDIRAKAEKKQAKKQAKKSKKSNKSSSSSNDSSSRNGDNGYDGGAGRLRPRVPGGRESGSGSDHPAYSPPASKLPARPATR